MATLIEDAVANIEKALIERGIVRDELIIKNIEKVPDVNRADDQYYQQFFESGHWAVIDETCRLDRLTIMSEMQRNKGRFKFQPLAATKARRAAAVKQAIATGNALAKRGPKIEAEMQKLSEELTALKTADREAAQVVAGHESAVAQLRKYAPHFIKERHNRAVKELAARRRAGEVVTAEDEAATEAILDYYCL